ncbi:hypothetical protein ES707_10435 [subsurface metagenome]
MEPATIAILCVILGCLLRGGYVIGRKLGNLEQSVKTLTDRQDKSNEQKENLDTHMGKIFDRLTRIETKLGINEK